MSIFKKYRRKGLSEMREYIKGEDLTHISVAGVDNPEEDMGMVARNPNDHNDQWYVARQYFIDNLEAIEEIDNSIHDNTPCFINGRIFQSIQEASVTLNVSPATIGNWIKNPNSRCASIIIEGYQ